MQVSIVYGSIDEDTKITTELMSHSSRSTPKLHIFPPPNCLVSNLHATVACFDLGVLRNGNIQTQKSCSGQVARPLFSLRSPDPNGTHDIFGLGPENNDRIDHSETHGANV